MTRRDVAVARDPWRDVAATPWQGAYGKYMHKVGSPYHMNPDVPPMQDPAEPEHDGWAYGAFLPNRYTEWDAEARELGLYYLMSLSSPYQVQLMHSSLRLA